MTFEPKKRWGRFRGYNRTRRRMLAMQVRYTKSTSAGERVNGISAPCPK